MFVLASISRKYLQMTQNTQPVNQQTLNNAQSDKAQQAMDGIKPTDINQDNLSEQKQAATDDSLLDMMTNANKPD